MPPRVCHFGRIFEAFYKREVFEHRKFLDFVERLRANPTGFRVSAAQSKNLKKFLKDEYLNKKTNVDRPLRFLFAVRLSWVLVNVRPSDPLRNPT